MDNYGFGRMDPPPVTRNFNGHLDYDDNRMLFAWILASGRMAYGSSFGDALTDAVLMMGDIDAKIREAGRAVVSGPGPEPSNVIRLDQHRK